MQLLAYVAVKTELKQRECGAGVWHSVENAALGCIPMPAGVPGLNPNPTSKPSFLLMSTLRGSA